jgi:putative transposase
VRYACIRRHIREFTVSLMCRTLEVSRSGFYAWSRRPPSARAESEQRLRVEITAIHRLSRGSYGSPRVHAELQASGQRVNLKRVARVMRTAGLKGKKRRRFRCTTNSAHVHPIAPNVLARRFSMADGQNQVWVADITYIPTRQRSLYLAIVVDLASRMVVGWAMRDTMESELATDALEMALQRRRPPRGLIHHSDRGVQYASTNYRERLGKEGAVVSMSRKGDCWDNAVAESFFATLEVELIEDADWHTHQEARRAIFEYIEVWYNRQRRHSTLGYISPAEFEKRMLDRGATAAVAA